MYCSNCGTPEQTAKTYCRKCGKWIGTGAPEERMTVMIVFNLLSAIFGAAAAIALYLTYFGDKTAKWSVYVAATFCLIISVYQTLSFFFALNLRSRLKQGQASSTELGSKDVRELPEADASMFVQSRSVTENTTELLERKSQNG
jgi:hypothetical protein